MKFKLSKSEKKTSPSKNGGRTAEEDRQWRAAFVEMRARNLAILTERFLPAHDKSFSMLCIGCRSGMELDTVESICGVKTRGIDLSSNDPRIDIGDMEKMTYANNSFDAVYSSHSLHHAHDIAGTVQEFIRVVKPGGIIIIEVPTQLDLGITNEKPLRKRDPQSSKRILEQAANYVDEVLYQEDTSSPRDMHLICRLIFSVKK